MDMFALVAAFGGGAFGALLGALPAFIMTGCFALAGALISAAGGADIGVAFLAFGSFMGPHIAFGGGVAAAAYAGKKGSLKAGNDIVTALNGLGQADVIIVGGIFGVLGYIICALLMKTPLGPMTDAVAMTVAASGCIARLTFGKTGLLGKYTGKGPRVWITGGSGFSYNVMLGAVVGIAVSFVAAQMKSAGVSDVALGSFPVICFGFSAITLIFAQTGFAVPTTHHITLPSALGALTGIAAWGPAGAALGVVIGILASLLGDFAGNAFNSHNDSHIDPPAITIFTLTIVVSIIRMMIVK
ncbi:MAG: hypothetical protein Q4D58_03510 [Synergistaceae bacterium]|nr:hypothetical protein [Synergistaceae bacterium]